MGRTVGGRAGVVGYERRAGCWRRQGQKSELGGQKEGREKGGLGDGAAPGAPPRKKKLNE